jgi:hypothetical protein
MFLNDKIRTVCLAGIVLCVSGWFAAANAADGFVPAPAVMAPPPQPTKMPEFDFANLHGGALKSSELKGKVIVIRFWATW